MTFEQLDYFIALVNADTFFDAAEQCHMTQSTLSKQIMKLEKELNIRLFDRSRRKAVLTEAGQHFYTEALQLSAQYHKALANMQKYQNSETQELHIGFLPILTQYHLTALFKDFSKQYPQIHLILDDVEEEELTNGLDSGRFDLVITRENTVSPERHRFECIAKDRLMAILPIRHPLAEKKEISLTELSGESFILMKPYTAVYKMCLQLFDLLHIHPDIRRTARMESIIGAVSFGEGISLLPEKNFLLFQQDSLTGIPVSEAPPLSVGIAALKSGHQNSSTDTLIQYAKCYDIEVKRL